MNIQFLKLIATYLILLQCIQIVISDDSNSICSGCKVDNNICKTKEDSTEPYQCNEYYCKPNKENNKCFDCSSVLKISVSKYYSIENNVCIGKLGSDCNKIIIENNQCVDACPGDLYEFGDFCYKKCYDNNEGGVDLGLEIEQDEPTKKCKCKDNNKYLIEETINNKKYFRCVDNCPSGYFDANTKKCVVKCEGATNRITPENGCTNICSDGQFLFEQSEKINGETITKLYCVSKCPDEARFYYTNTNFQNPEKKCLKECNRDHFYSIDNYECLESCDGISNIDLSANIFQCKSSSIDSPTPQCDDSFPYEYQRSCLRNCSDTQNLEIFGNKITYFLEYTDGDNNKKKFCSEKCQEDTPKKYRNLNTLSCHSSCEETSHKFNLNNECVKSCDSPTPYHLYDTGTCVANCE